MLVPNGMYTGVVSSRPTEPFGPLPLPCRAVIGGLCRSLTMNNI